MKMKIKFKKLHEDAIMPTYARAWDAGADLYSTEDSFYLPPKSITIVSTGIAIEIPPGYVGLIHPRSGMAMRGISVANSPGTIDAGYRGELKILMQNHTQDEYSIKKGDKIAQLVIQEVIEAQFVEVDELSDAERGLGGFGSTGV